MRRACKARQYSDQMNCAACGLCWDVNDPDPPPCPEDRDDEEDKAPAPARDER